MLMDLSIIIVNWNTREFLSACLRSIEANPPACAYEVLVIDNASADGSAEMVRESFPRARLIANEKNLGYAEGNNRGFRESSGEYILLLNADVQVKAGALDALLRFGRDHSHAAAVGCRLVGLDGRVQRSCRSFPDPWGVLFEYAGLSRVFPGSRFFGRYRMTYFPYTREAEVDQPMGSCLLLSRQAIADVGKFDQDFPIFFNEVDWCWRAKAKGWRIYFMPDAEVIHHGGASTSQMRPEMIRESHRALKTFYAKHYRGRIGAPMYALISGAISVNSFLTSRLRSGGK